MKNKVLFSIICVLVIAAIASFLITQNNEDNELNRQKSTMNCKHNNPSKIVILEAKAPTCQITGLTEGSKCMQCGTVIIKQKNIDKVGCVESDWIIDFEATPDRTGKKHTECIECGKIISTEIIPVDTTILYYLQPMEFVNLANELFDNGNYIDEAKLRYFQTLSAIHMLVTDRYTSDEMYELVSTSALANFGVTQFQIDQMYGLYFWDDYGHNTVAFETMLNFMAYTIAVDEDANSLMDERTAQDLVDLAEGIDVFKTHMNTDITKEEFAAFLEDQNIDLPSGSDTIVNLVFSMTPQNSNGACKIVDLLRTFKQFSSMIPGDSDDVEMGLTLMDNYIYVYDVLDDKCSYDEFALILSRVVSALANEDRTVNASDTLVQQAYIMYFNSLGVISDEEINGLEFIQFVNSTIETNPTVSANITEHSKQSLQDVEIINEFVCDLNEYNYEEMATQLDELRDTTTLSSFSKDDVKAVYRLYMEQNQ